MASEVGMPVVEESDEDELVVEAELWAAVDGE